jgi:hypothetical protein
MGQRGPGTEVAKLLEIKTGPGALKRVKLRSVPAVAGGGRLRDGLIYQAGDFSVRRAIRAGGPRIIRGQDASAVHEQLVELFESNPERVVDGLICHIQDSADAQNPPRTYPLVNLGESLQSWFKDLVEWWQSPESGLGKPFTHGQRIRLWNGDHDQLLDIVAELRAKSDTTRAVALLIDPNSDHTITNGRRREFPAFCLVQFVLRDRQLHATAIFRKQEMKYWWPINVAEIARLQTDIARRLSIDVSTRPGSITTYAIVAVAGSTVPRVAVPKIERATWEEPNLRWQLSAAILNPAALGRLALIERLRDMLTEWRPTSNEPAPDGVPMPVRGMQALIEALVTLREVYPPSPAADRLIELLAQIASLNEQYRDRDVSDDRLYRAWKTAVSPLLVQAEEVCSMAGGGLRAP